MKYNQHKTKASATAWPERVEYSRRSFRDFARNFLIEDEEMVEAETNEACMRMIVIGASWLPVQLQEKQEEAHGLKGYVDDENPHSDRNVADDPYYCSS